jgi:hypothetical protein
MVDKKSLKGIKKHYVRWSSVESSWIQKLWKIDMHVNSKKQKLDFVYEIREAIKAGIILYNVCMKNLNTENIRNMGTQNFTIFFSAVLMKPG